MMLTQNHFCKCIPQKWITMLFCFLGLFNAFTMRVCLFIAITEMTIPIDKTVEFPDDTCPSGNESDESKNVTTATDELYDWDEETQGLILSSFFWGYFITSISGGVIADKFGGKHTLGFCVLSVSALTLLTPVGVKWGGSTALVVIRVLMGIGEGSLYPAVSALMARWIPRSERSWAASWALCGDVIGSIFGLTISGIILQYSAWGWPAVFYVFGIVGIISYLFHCLFCYSRPSDSPFISDAEAKYLKDNIKQVNRNLSSVPWRHILQSKPVWALLIVTTGETWGLFTVSSDMPKYMSNVLRLPADQNGFLVSIAPLCAFVSSLIISWTADKVIAKGFLSTIMVRKIGSTIALVGSGVFLVAIPYAGCNATLAVAFNTIYGILFSFVYSSLIVNAIDLSPNYTGTLMGILYGISALGAFLAPYVVGVLTPNQTISEWKLVFWIVFVVYVMTNFVFLVFGSAEVQDWNDPEFLKKANNRKNANTEQSEESVNNCIPQF